MVEASVIVCTRDRRGALLRLLESLVQSAAEAAPYEIEIIAVDDGSTDGTAEAAAQFAGTTQTPIHVVRQEGQGLSSGRNAGLRQAGGRLVAFVDDDCIVSPSYLRQMIGRFAADTEDVLRGGRVELGDPDDAPLTIKTSLAVERLAIGDRPGGFILGCNMAMTRGVLAAVGPFDERFGAGGFLRSAEDTDFVLRALLADVPVEYVPDMAVFHHHGRRRRADVERIQRNYNVGDGALMLKHARRAPWLFRNWYWSLRNALKETVGGPLFDTRLGLSHAPVAFHHLVGAVLFITAKIRRQPAWRGPVLAGNGGVDFAPLAASGFSRFGVRRPTDGAAVS
ncbi:MAG: glycosyl transferase [Caulobacteraceae bacterium]|nr:glycosyl transferase [Caulobacteraceae bacterium]